MAWSPQGQAEDAVPGTRDECKRKPFGCLVSAGEPLDLPCLSARAVPQPMRGGGALLAMHRKETAAREMGWHVYRRAPEGSIILLVVFLSWRRRCKSTKRASVDKRTRRAVRQSVSRSAGRVPELCQLAATWEPGPAPAPAPALVRQDTLPCTLPYLGKLP